MTYNFNLDWALKNLIVCQKRTRKTGQYVFMSGDYVVKGPYQNTDKLNRILSHNQQLKEWNAPYVVYPLPEQLQAEEGIFLTFPNLAQGYPAKCEPYTEKFFGREMNILIRTPGHFDLIKLGDVLTQLDWIGPHIPHIILTHLYLFILGVGDVGLSNILVDLPKQKVYVIDCEEQRRTTRDDEFFYFTQKPAKVKAEFWVQYARPYYSTLAQQISALNLSDPTHVSNRDLAVQLLTRYSSEPDINIVAKDKPDSQNQGKMVFSGPSKGGITYSGHPTDQVKSGLQKYVRQNVPVKAIKSAIELYRMVEVGGGVVQSNMYNRVAVIAAEDVGIGNFSLAVAVIKYVLEINKNRERRNPSELAGLVQLLSSSEKSRIGSHLFKTYAVPEGQQIGKSQFNLQTTDVYDPDLSNPNFESIFGPDFHSEEDPHQLKMTAEMFARRLVQNSPLMVFWLGIYLKHFGKEKIKRRRRRTQSMILIWDILRRTPKYPDEVYNVLEKAWFDFSEKRPFIMLLISALLMEVPYQEYNLEPQFEIWRTSDIILEFTQPGEDYSFELDPYVIDIHTREGRQRGATKHEFAQVGAQVEPRSESYIDPNLEHIYKLSYANQ